MKVDLLMSFNGGNELRTAEESLMLNVNVCSYFGPLVKPRMP